MDTGSQIGQKNANKDITICKKLTHLKFRLDCTSGPFLVNSVGNQPDAQPTTLSRN